MTVSNFSLGDLSIVSEEIQNPSIDGKFVKAFQAPWLECGSDDIIPLNLDGEPYRNKHIRFEILPGAISLVLPEICPLIK